jgi:hypothetical protein
MCKALSRTHPYARVKQQVNNENSVWDDDICGERERSSLGGVSYQLISRPERDCVCFRGETIRTLHCAL